MFPGYSEKLAASDKEGAELYNVTQVTEGLIAFPRFGCSLVIWGIVFGIIYGIVEVVYLFADQAGFLPGPNGTFQEMAFDLVRWIVGIAWLAVAVFCAFFPSIWSWWSLKFNRQDSTYYALGAREHSKREELLILEALLRLEDTGHADVKAHDRAWVIDDPMPRSFTVGTDLYLTTGILEKKYLPGVIAHEMAHLYQKDGKMVQAIRNFVYPFIRYRTQSKFSGQRQPAAKDVVEVVEVLGHQVRIFKYSFLFGGLAAILFNFRWAYWWRERDYLADMYACHLGFAEDLLAYLQENKEIDAAVPFMANWIAYSELRIDRILQNQIVPA